jgi:N-acetylmuramoyl-L-alanine amidase
MENLRRSRVGRSSVPAMRCSLRTVAVALPALLLGTLLATIAGPVAASSSSPAAAARAAAGRPAIVARPIPFGPKRKREMAAYSRRHYGEDTWRLVHPRVIVEHMAEAGSAGAVFNAFAPDVPDVELHELPNVCAHFVVASSGRIERLVNLRTRCRHTVGLNWTAIGIEHVGYADGDVLGNSRQLRASLRLTQWLRCKFHVKLVNVIGHNESLSSPYHRELVPSLRNQTHGDWRHSSMRVYRKRLWRMGPC